MRKKEAKILVIDDEQGICDFLSYELGSQGYAVTTANAGAVGLDLLRLDRYDLLICDVKMPQMDGIQVLKQAKKIDPDLEVIMVTGFATIETAIAAMKQGAYDYVQKPFNLQEIGNLIEKALEKGELKSLVALYEASRTIFSQLKTEELLATLADLSRRLLGADEIAVFLAEEEGGMRLAASRGLAGAATREALLACAERAGRAGQGWTEIEALESPLERDARFKGLKGELPIHALLLCPLLSRRRRIGLLCAARTQEARPFDTQDRRHAAIFTAQIAQAIDNAELYEKLARKLAELNDAYHKLSTARNELIQSEKLAAIGELAAGVAHELNNPLTAVIGLTELLLEEENLAPDFKADLKTIHEQTGRCRRIILNLLQFARKHEHSKKNASLNEVLESALELVHYEMHCSGIAVAREYAAGLPEVEVDAHQMQQVFLNIINNARHALKGVSNARLCLKTEKRDGEVCVAIVDNGCGIPEKIRNKIFDPFFTTKGVGEGTGLGLSISYGIVKEHGGSISVQSEVGNGTTFLVHLPCRKSGEKT